MSVVACTHRRQLLRSYYCMVTVTDKQRVIKVAGTQPPACPPPVKRPRESEYINDSFGMCRCVCVLLTYLLN